MKNLLLILFISSLLVACVEVKYEQAQPQKVAALKSFPADLQGKYFLFSADTAVAPDTITIGENYFTELKLTFGQEKEEIKEEKKVFLSDSLVLKAYEKNYILNFRDKDMWTALVLQPKKDFGYFVLWIDGNNDESVEKMQLITKTKIIKNDEGEIEKYLINPKKSVFKKLINAKGVFTELYQLKKLEK